MSSTSQGTPRPTAASKGPTSVAGTQVEDGSKPNFGDDPREDLQILFDDVERAAVQYWRKRPMVTAGAVLAVGFFLGWKLKPW